MGSGPGISPTAHRGETSTLAWMSFSIPTQHFCPQPSSIAATRHTPHLKLQSHAPLNYVEIGTIVHDCCAHTLQSPLRWSQRACLPFLDRKCASRTVILVMLVSMLGTAGCAGMHSPVSAKGILELCVVERYLPKFCWHTRS